jgi:hypothetical protein
VKARIYKRHLTWYLEVPKVGMWQANDFEAIFRQWQGFLRWAQ